MIEIKDIEDSNYSRDGYALEVYSSDGKDKYVIEEYGSINDDRCLYRVMKNGELVEDMETKKDLLNSVVYHLANNQKRELSILVLMAYLEYHSNGTDNVLHAFVPNFREKLKKKNINRAIVPEKNFAIVLVETRKNVKGRVSGHISTLIVDKEKNKYYLLDPSEGVHQQGTQNKAYAHNGIFDRDEIGKNITVLNKGGILLQNEWSCTYWAMCSTKVFLSKGSIEHIIDGNTLKAGVFDKIVEEIQSINGSLVNTINCGIFRDQLERNREKPPHSR